MIKVEITDKELSQAASNGISDFLDLIIEKTRTAIGGELSADNMQQMSSQQITLIGYATLRDELMNGGFIQLIHNGYGAFFFHNPFDVAMRQWGINDLFGLRGVRFSGFVDVWDGGGHLTALSEPQLWYNFGPHFALGGEVELSYGFVSEGFKALPCAGFKWTF